VCLIRRHELAQDLAGGRVDLIHRVIRVAEQHQRVVAARRLAAHAGASSQGDDQPDAEHPDP